jgi:hypothetical protein
MYTFRCSTGIYILVGDLSEQGGFDRSMEGGTGVSPRIDSVLYG